MVQFPTWKKYPTGFFLFLFLLISADALAQSVPSSPQSGQPRATLPAQYGEVIFRYNENSPKQVFVIGMTHRDTLTRGNASQTSRVQAEVYKIGDWLIHNGGLQLLLPEGFFKTKTTEVRNVNERIKTGLENKNACLDLADFKTLQAKLADDQIFVNAEMLLKESHPMRLQQVEDWALYESVSRSLLKLASSDKNSCDVSLVPELDYLQEKRLAAMLQRIPEVVGDEFQHKEIKEKKAIFTIGVMHVHTIMKYLIDKKIAIHSPSSDSKRGQDYAAELNLSKENFGVSIIIPRTLADNQEILKTNQLDKIIPKTHKVHLN